MHIDSTQDWIQLKYFELLWEPPCENDTLSCLCFLSSWPFPWKEHRFWRKKELSANANYRLSEQH